MALTPYQDAHRKATEAMREALKEQITRTDYRGTNARMISAIVGASLMAMSTEMDNGKPYEEIKDAFIVAITNASLSFIGTLTGGPDDNGKLHRGSIEAFLSELVECVRDKAGNDFRDQAKATQVEFDPSDGFNPVEGRGAPN